MWKHNAENEVDFNFGKIYAHENEFDEQSKTINQDVNESYVQRAY